MTFIHSTDVFPAALWQEIMQYLTREDIFVRVCLVDRALRDLRKAVITWRDPRRALSFWTEYWESHSLTEQHQSTLSRVLGKVQLHRIRYCEYDLDSNDRALWSLAMFGLGLRELRLCFVKCIITNADVVLVSAIRSLQQLSLAFPPDETEPADLDLRPLGLLPQLSHLELILMVNVTTSMPELWPALKVLRYDAEYERQRLIAPCLEKLSWISQQTTHPLAPLVSQTYPQLRQLDTNEIFDKFELVEFLQRHKTTLESFRCAFPDKEVLQIFTNLQELVVDDVHRADFHIFCHNLSSTLRSLRFNHAWFEDDTDWSDLDKLVSLEEVHFNVCDSLNMALWRTLALLPRLQMLTVHDSDCEPMPQLFWFTGLRFFRCSEKGIYAKTENGWTCERPCKCCQIKRDGTLVELCARKRTYV
jgi:hypothetical protein